MVGEFKYNPFGSTESTYHYDFESDEKTRKSKAPWLIGILVVLLSLTAIVYSVFVFSMVHQKRDAKESIDEFNSSLTAVHQTFSDPMFASEMNKAIKNAEAQGGVSEVTMVSSELLEQLARSLQGEPPVDIGYTDDDSTAATQIAPYYAMCDLSENSLGVKTYNHQQLCSSFSDKARQMMSDTRGYNMNASGWVGTLTFHTDRLVDVMGKGENMLEDTEDSEGNKESEKESEKETRDSEEKTSRETTSKNKESR